MYANLDGNSLQMSITWKTLSIQIYTTVISKGSKNYIIDFKPRYQ